jgi:hypothetical protein
MLASKVITDASVILIDTELVRWPARELAGWLDHGVLSIITVKPSASSETIALSLARGTKQALPADQRIRQLLDLTRNLGGSNGAAGRAIRSVSRAELDGNQPNWHDPRYVPFKKEVRQFVFDEALPREFYVVPGNDGTGSVEAAVATLPERVVDRVTANVDLAESYAIEVGIGDEYEPALLDYVLYRAFSKEDPAAAPARAVTHYQAFATAIGLQSQVETATSPGRKR